MADYSTPDHLKGPDYHKREYRQEGHELIPLEILNEFHNVFILPSAKKPKRDLKLEDIK
ncbi:MAG: hypothetical protein ACE5DM_05225 [Candidatus Nanoarchaeia archaeon]